LIYGGEGLLRVRREWNAVHHALPPQTDERFVADHLLRYKNRPSYAYQAPDGGGTSLRYTNNALGLRGPEISRAKPPGVRRVVLVGGSTVYGALVDDSHTLSVQLETLLHDRLGPNVQVINGGVPGYEALRELVFSAADLLDLSPDVLIAVDGLNDVFYGSLEEWPSQVAADQQPIIADGRFPDVVAMIDATMFPNGLLEHHVTMFGRTLRPLFYGAVRQTPPAAPRIANARVIALHASSLGLLARYGRAASIPVIACLQPLVATGHKQLTVEEEDAVMHEGYWNVGGWPEIAVATYPMFAATSRSAVEAERGTFLDLTGVFDDEPGSTYGHDGVHYSALGNRRLADALVPLIEENLRQRDPTL
jgi:hypothetical protein